MFSQSFVDAVAEAERLVAAAPFIETEADLLEGLQYLAGCIASCTHVAFDFDKDHPFLHSGTGPFEKMGLQDSLFAADWWGFQFWRFVFVQQQVGKLAETAIDFPPMQPSASFNLSAVKEQIDKAVASRTGQ